jgi:hypothetical protein
MSHCSHLTLIFCKLLYMSHCSHLSLILCFNPIFFQQKTGPCDPHHGITQRGVCHAYPLPAGHNGLGGADTGAGPGRMPCGTVLKLYTTGFFFFFSFISLFVFILYSYKIYFETISIIFILQFNTFNFDGLGGADTGAGHGRMPCGTVLNICSAVFSFTFSLICWCFFLYSYTIYFETISIILILR